MYLIYGSLGLSKRTCEYLISFSPLKVSFKSWSIVFFGSDFFSLKSLVELHKQTEIKVIRNVEVVTKNCDTPVYKFASSKNIKVHIWPPILTGKYDFGVIASFGKFIPKEILDQFPLGIINVHASLLPRWRGGMPIVHAIKNGDTVTGITIIRINSDAFDTGEVVMQKSCPIGKNELLPSLFNKLSKLGSECLLEVIGTIPECFKNSVQQSKNNVSYATRLKKDVAIVKWNEMTAVEVYNLYRALFNLYKIKTNWCGKQVELICMSFCDFNEKCTTNSEKNTPSPGSIVYDPKNRWLMVQCKDKPITLCTLSINGKLYTAAKFYQGFLASAPVRLKFDCIEV